MKKKARRKPLETSRTVFVDSVKNTAEEEMLEGLGIVCAASGTVAPSTDALSVCVQSYEGDLTDVEVTDEMMDTICSNGEPIPVEDGAWSTGSLQGVVCGTTNTLLAVGLWEVEEDGGIFSYPRASGKSLPFMADCEGCPIIREASDLSTFSEPPAEVIPSARDDGFLYYGRLSVSNRTGNCLMHGGAHLRARTIAIAAADVEWRPNASAERIRHPLGNHASAGVLWRFDRRPEYSVVVWQFLGTTTHVVGSLDRERPDFVDLDPRAPIYVQVNDRRLPLSGNNYADNTGSFALWVKVIS